MCVQNFNFWPVLSSQTTKLHLILRGSPNFKSLVLSSQTTKLHLISHVCSKFQDLACLVKPNYKTTPYFERVPKFQASCLVKPNYKTTPDFASVSKISIFGLSCQAKLQNYALFWEGPQISKSLVLSSQTTKLHMISRVCPKFQDLACLVKPNYKTTPYFERVPKFQGVFSCQAKLQKYTQFHEHVKNLKVCLVLSSQTTKLHLILWGSPNYNI